MEGNDLSGNGQVKAVILIGGPEKGTRFRPLSFDCPKPLFPVAGEPMLSHLIEACCRVPGLAEICIIGWYQAAPNDELAKYIYQTQKRFDVPIRYLQEFTPLGTAGSVYHFRDQILAGPQVSSIILLNGDVCGDFPLVEMLDFQSKRPDAAITMLATEATRSQSVQFGCIVEDPATHRVLHYINKPQSYVSSLISCGVYVLRPSCISIMSQIFEQRKTGVQKIDVSPSRQAANMYTLSFEDDVLPRAASAGQLYAHRTINWWSQVKTAASTVYANRHYLRLYRENRPLILASEANCKAKIIGDVFIHPAATIHATAEIGPNVSIGAGVKIGAGTRIRESIILGDAVIGEHCCILFSIIGWGCQTGDWVRIEGFPNDPDPNKPFAKLEHLPMFTLDGKLNPSLTILGGRVEVPSEIIVLNAIVLPNKCLDGPCKNQIMF